MNSLLPLETVTERDIDVLLIEELQVDDQFLEALLSQIGFDGSLLRREGVWHSVTDPALGESDVVLLLWEEGRRQAVLIENKIDAPPQPDQAKRYRQRGKQGIQDEQWDSFTTCIVAPEKYLDGVGDASLYDVSIPYEWIADFLQNTSGLPEQRREFREQIIRQAIEQNRRGYTARHDERVTAFWRGYWARADEAFPELGMQEPLSKPAGSDWINLRPATLPNGFTILHKLSVGSVDLQTPWAATDIEVISESCGRFLHSDMSVQQTTKSCSIRIDVPSLDRFKDFEGQSNEALMGMKAAYRLSFLGSALENTDPTEA